MSLYSMYRCFQTVWWALAVVVLVVRAREPPQDMPQDTLQDLNKDLDRMMEDERMFNEYYRCLLNEGPCSTDSSNFKDVIQEALEHGCARCSANQRRGAISVLRQVMECRPREYAEIERQFDPKGAFKDKYKMSLMGARKCRL